MYVMHYLYKKNVLFCFFLFFFVSIITHVTSHIPSSSSSHIIASELKVGIGGSSRVVVFVTRIAHKLESDIRGRMADEVRRGIQPRIAVFAQTELVFMTFLQTLFFGQLDAGLVWLWLLWLLFWL